MLQLPHPRTTEKEEIISVGEKGLPIFASLFSVAALPLCGPGPKGQRRIRKLVKIRHSWGKALLSLLHNVVVARLHRSLLIVFVSVFVFVLRNPHGCRDG